ncbi:Solute carrier organic anion transporter family member 4A1 [Frankliniella fusca]|uniref:Solute carrier organic anion transporter family member n=1 Tax=Frankliniella fusca TaxID=407009 RepID=A0AAE1HT14_9NEOP|nr:Solute carrier organic anion transporter family member 4A1 [Frankliniella fusca]
MVAEDMEYPPGDPRRFETVELGVVNPAFTSDELSHQVGEAEEQYVNGSRQPQAPHHAMSQEKKSAADEEEARQARSLRCGWGCLQPDCLQRFRTAKWVLFWLCWAGGIQGMVVNGFVNVVITTIERRFGLRSSQSGLVAGGYDIASFLCLVPVTYLGGRPGASKARWIGWGVVLMGCGSLLFATPHFLVGPYRVASQQQDTCSLGNSTVSSSPGECDAAAQQPSSSSDGHLYLWLFLLGQLLHGAGSAPLFTLGVTFIDENVSKKMSSVYLGVFYTMAVVGPAMGYVLGGQLLRIYTDFLTTDAGALGLTPLSNVWVGAWWVGFIASAVLCFVLAIPLLAFPVEMPGAAELRAEKVCEAHGPSSSSAAAFSKLHEMPAAFRALIVNPAFFFLNMAGASEGLLLAGFAAFLPKLIENQFSVAASRAALLMGLVTVPAGGGGTFLGGYLVKRFSLSCSAIIKLCIATAAIGVVFTLCFFISCPNIAFAGVTRAYGDAENSSASMLAAPALGSACNAGCRCEDTAYNPVCGADNVLYYSPCHAGCAKEVMLDTARVYQDCACVNAVPAAPLSAPLERRRRRRYTAPGDDPEEDGEESAFVIQDRSGKGGAAGLDYEAVNEPCTSGCNLLWVFVALAFFTMLFTFLITMPALTATLRCVQEEQRSFALGIQWIKVRLLGTIPAPMIFGLLIDETCVLWQLDQCTGEAGSCIAYDNLYMSRYMLALAFVGKTCSLLFFFLAWRLYKPPIDTSKDRPDPDLDDAKIHAPSLPSSLSTEQQTEVC